MRQWKEGFKTREEAKARKEAYIKDGFMAKIVVDHEYGEYDEALPYVVIITDFRSPKHALTESYNRLNTAWTGRF